MNRTKISQQHVVDVHAAKAQTNSGTAVQFPMKGNQSRAALRVDRTGSDGNQVEVADAAHIVTGSRRTADEQFA